MHDRYDRNDSLVSWMIAGGARFDESDHRHLSHLVALRDAKRESSRSLAWLTARLAPKATVAASASGVASAAISASSTGCCAPA